MTANIINTHAFSDFINAVRKYCRFIEAKDPIPEKEFLREAQMHLFSLYTLAQHIPPINLEVKEDFEIDIDESVIESVLNTISHRLPFSYYWVVLNSVDMTNSAETGTGDLVDDLGDIYQDLKSALNFFDREDIGAKENAIWKFKFDFESHWGTHCIDAMGAIHYYLVENKDQ